MKITPTDLAALAGKVKPLDTTERRAKYLAGDFKNSRAVKDLNKRYRFDLLWLSGLKIGDGVGVKGELDLYSYMNDTHIDTALKHIVPNLK